MTASLLQAFMDQLMNPIIASVTIIIGGITALAVIDSVPRISRWGFSNVLTFFGKEKEKIHTNIHHSNPDHTHDLHHLSPDNANSQELIDDESTDYVDDENEPISKKEAS